MNFKIFAIIIVSIALSGCATPQIPLSKQAQSNIDRVEGIFIIPQNNLDVTVQATEGGSGGFLGVLLAAALDSARQSSAQKAAAPMLEPLRGYDFRTVMLDASNDALTKIDKVRFEMPLRVNVVASDSARRIALDKSTASALLFCHVNYRLELGNLIVTANAEMYPKINTLKQFRSKPDESNTLDIGNVIYKNTFTFSKQAVTPANIQESLTEAAANIAHQLATDLNHGL